MESSKQNLCFPLDWFGTIMLVDLRKWINPERLTVQC